MACFKVTTLEISGLFLNKTRNDQAFMKHETNYIVSYI